MLKKILPSFINNALENLDYNLLQEIHLRNNNPIIIVYNSQKRYLLNGNLNIKITKKDLDDIIFKASNFSIYSIQNQIKEGYITLKNGIRIGLSGEFAYDNHNIKNLYSLNIRIPHQIHNCSKNIFNKLFDDKKFLNTLIISPPGAGKTTMIRDILFQFNKINEIYNISLIDERNEISSLIDGIPSLDIGQYCDIISHINKEKAAFLAIKNLNPDIVVTDEISSIEDINTINKIANMGISILASIHAENINDLLKKENFNNLIENFSFERYVILSKKNMIGEIVGVFDKSFKKL